MRKRFEVLSTADPLTTHHSSPSRRCHPRGQLHPDFGGVSLPGHSNRHRVPREPPAASIPRRRHFTQSDVNVFLIHFTLTDLHAYIVYFRTYTYNNLFQVSLLRFYIENGFSFGPLYAIMLCMFLLLTNRVIRRSYTNISSHCLQNDVDELLPNRYHSHLCIDSLRVAASALFEYLLSIRIVEQHLHTFLKICTHE